MIPVDCGIRYPLKTYSAEWQEKLLVGNNYVSQCSAIFDEYVSMFDIRVVYRPLDSNDDMNPQISLMMHDVHNDYDSYSIHLNSWIDPFLSCSDYDGDNDADADVNDDDDDVNVDSVDIYKAIDDKHHEIQKWHVMTITVMPYDDNDDDLFGFGDHYRDDKDSVPNHDDDHV